MANDSSNSDEVCIHSHIEEIARDPNNAEYIFKTIKEKLEKNPDENIQNLLKEGETVLHTAIKRFSGKSAVEKSVIEYFANEFPMLIQQDRINSECDGQTPLHMAVCKGNKWMVKTLLKVLSEDKKTSLLKKKARGHIFHDTVMMGELPLIIAALTFKKDIFDLLIKEGAELDANNSYGEYVSHSLIRYASLYPEKLDKVLDMCCYINEYPSVKDVKMRILCEKIWLMENVDGLNPLQLSAKLGQHKLFEFIMNLKEYCVENSEAGLFDIKMYDVTDFDAVDSMKTEDITGKNDEKSKTSDVEKVAVKRTTATQPKPCTNSILMMMFELKPCTAFQFLQLPSMRLTIDSKWKFYQRAFYVWGIIHFFFVCFLTWYSVERAQQNFNNGTQFDVNSKPNFKTEITKHGFVTAFGAITLLVSALYIAQEILRLIQGKMPLTLNSFQNPYCNSWFRLLFVLFALVLVVDFILAIVSEYYENFCLIIAVVMGWFSILFFLRVVRLFSFVTVLIQNVLFGDMSRFFVIIILEIIAFSTAMYMVIQGSDVISSTDFSNYARVVLSMFKLMVGLGEIAALYDTRYPALAIIIFVGFIIMTTLLILNALIALISKTCGELVENVGDMDIRYRHWQLQRLSVILFIESILPQIIIGRVGEETEMVRYSTKLQTHVKMKQYMLEIRSMHNESDDKEGRGMFTNMFNVFKDKLPMHPGSRVEAFTQSDNVACKEISRVLEISEYRVVRCDSCSATNRSMLPS